MKILFLTINTTHDVWLFDIEKLPPWCFLQFTRVLTSRSNSSICLISPHRQPFIGRIWMFLANMLYENLVFMVIWDSHNPKESSRVINNWFLSKNPKKICNNPCNRNRLKDKYLTWRYLAGTSVKKSFLLISHHLTLDIKKSPPFCPLQFVRVSQSFQLDVSKGHQFLYLP